MAPGSGRSHRDDGRVNWLPPPARDDTVTARPWRPPSLARVDLEGFSYVVVDDIDGSAAGLAVSAWPRVDSAGRIRFSGGAVMLGADANALQLFLAEHRRPRELAERPLRIGDVFAVQPLAGALEQVRAELDERRRLNPFLDPASWMRPPVYDISADAREAAKASFYAAVTPTLEPESASELEGLLEEG